MENISCLHAYPEKQRAFTGYEKRRPIQSTQIYEWVTHFSRDKLGLNLSILIVQFSYLLQKGDFEKVAEKMEMLQSYRSRYLAKNKVHFRSNIFLKMLFFYAKYYNDRKKLIWRTDKLRQELKLHRESAYLTIETHEVIPYEVLWDLLTKPSKQPK